MSHYPDGRSVVKALYAWYGTLTTYSRTIDAGLLSSLAAASRVICLTVLDSMQIMASRSQLS